jgi:hypothetical protein
MIVLGKTMYYWFVRGPFNFVKILKIYKYKGINNCTAWIRLCYGLTVTFSVIPTMPGAWLKELL